MIVVSNRLGDTMHSDGGYSIISGGLQDVAVVFRATLQRMVVGLWVARASKFGLEVRASTNGDSRHKTGVLHACDCATSLYEVCSLHNVQRVFDYFYALRTAMFPQFQAFRLCRTACEQTAGRPYSSIRVTRKPQNRDIPIVTSTENRQLGSTLVLSSRSVPPAASLLTYQLHPPWQGIIEKHK